MGQIFASYPFPPHVRDGQIQQFESTVESHSAALPVLSVPTSGACHVAADIDQLLDKREHMSSSSGELFVIRCHVERLTLDRSIDDCLNGFRKFPRRCRAQVCALWRFMSIPIRPQDIVGALPLLHSNLATPQNAFFL